MPFLRQSYKQKPQAWGPGSQVRASIFKNAERIGIDPVSVKICIPFWGPGNQFNYAYTDTVINTNAVFENNSIKTSTSSGLYIPQSNYQNIQDLTIILKCKFLGGQQNYGRIFQKEYSNTSAAPYVSWGFQFDNEANELIFLIGTGVQLHQLNTTHPITAGSDGVHTGVYYKTVEGGMRTFYNGASTHVYGFPKGAIVYSPTGGNVNIGYQSISNINYSPIQYHVASLFSDTLSASKIAFLSANPYYLLQRVAPVYYSVPLSLNLTQYAFRFRNDNGSEAAATTLSDTNVTLAPGAKTRIRIGIDATGDPTSKQFQLEYRHKPSGGSFGTWGAVT